MPHTMYTPEELAAMTPEERAAYDAQAAQELAPFVQPEIGPGLRDDSGFVSPLEPQAPEPVMPWEHPDAVTPMEFPPPEWLTDADVGYHEMPEISPAEAHQGLGALADFGKQALGAVTQPIIGGAEQLEQTVEKGLRDYLDPTDVALDGLEEQERARREQAERTKAALEEQARWAATNVQMYRDAVLEANRRSQVISARAEELAHTEVDPGRWFKHASTIQLVGAGIESVLGGYFAATQGGANQGLAHVMSMVDRDIQAQLEDLHTKKFSINEQRGLLAEEYNRLGDLYSAQEAMREGALKRIEAEIAADMVLHEPESAAFQRRRALLMAIQQQGAELAQKRAQTMIDNFVKIDERNFQWAKLGMKPVGGGAGGRLGKYGVSGGEGSGQFGLYDVDSGQRVEAATEAEGKQLRMLLSNADRAAADLQELQKLREQADRDWPGEPDTKFYKTALGLRMNAVWADLFNVMKSQQFSNAGAALTPTELMMLSKTVGEATSWVDWSEAWKTTEEKLRTRVETEGAYLTGHNVRWFPLQRRTGAFDKGGVSMPSQPDAIDRVVQQAGGVKSPVTPGEPEPVDLRKAKRYKAPKKTKSAKPSGITVGEPTGASPDAPLETLIKERTSEKSEAPEAITKAAKEAQGAVDRKKREAEAWKEAQKILRKYRKQK